MKQIPLLFSNQSTRLIAVFILLIILGVIRWVFDESSLFNRTTPSLSPYSIDNTNKEQVLFYRRQPCICTRPVFGHKSNLLVIDETSPSLCSQYSTLRGAHQRIIAISMYGPKENSIFSANASLDFLHALIIDMTKTYSGWILRIYHDASIKEDIICPLECAHNHVDFCNASALGSLGSVSDYMPPKIWRFLPIGDLLVDIMASRDLDSPLPQREMDAVNEWLSTDRAWHVMRDHPFHSVPMLGGMWAFRSVLNRTFAGILLRKILDPALVSRYGGRGDQNFLSDHVWSHIQNDVIAHDSYLCTASYGINSRPWPTRRPLLNYTDCFVGCVRPCCTPLKYPFGECPMACRPKNHTDWTMC